MEGAVFTVGAVYGCRSACDHNCIWRFTVVKRTARFITIEGDGFTGRKRVGVKADYYGSGEIAYPLGTYSMAPIIRAEREGVPA